MKKLYSTIVISLLALQGYTQTYYPMLDSVSNVWTYMANLIPVRVQQPATTCDYNNFGSTTNEFYTLNDTVIGSYTYKVIYIQDINSGWPDCLYGYIREDTASKQIYFVDNVLSPPVLVYDFSMQVGDSIELDFLSAWGSYYQDGYYHLDSIATININAGPRRIFYLSLPGSFTQYPLEWIESVGHPGHLIYPYSLNFFGGMFFWCNDPIARDYYQMLTCFEHNASKVYFDSCAHAFAINNWCFYYADSCNYWNICGALPEDSPISDIRIGPNPVGETLNMTIEASRNIETEIVLRDLAGKQLYSSMLQLNTGSNQHQLNTQLLSNGMYILELRLPSGMTSKKLVRLSNEP